MMSTAAQLAEADRLWAEHFAGRTRDQMNDALNDLINGITEPAVIAILLTRAAEASVTAPDYGPIQMAGLGPWCPRCGYTTRPPIGEHLVRCPDENDVRAVYGDA